MIVTPAPSHTPAGSSGARLLRWSRRAILVCALVAIAAFAVAEAEPLLALVALPAAVGAWLLREHDRSRPAPTLDSRRWVLHALTFAIVVYAVYDAWQNAITIRQVGLLVVSLLVVKLLDRQAARDDAQVIILSVFLVIGAMLQSIGLSVGAIALGFVPVAITATMLHQLSAGHELASRASAPPQYARSLGHHGRAPATGPRSLAQLQRLALGSLATVLCIAIAVFVLLPRGIGANVLGEFAQRTSTNTETGFSDEIDLIGGSISQSDRIVMHVELSDVRGRNLGRSGSTHYLRGTVLDRYEDGRWVGRPTSSGPRPISESEPPRRVQLGRPDDPSRTIVQRITLLETTPPQTYLFSLLRPIALELDRSADVRHLDSHARIVASTGRGSLRYTVESSPTARGRLSGLGPEADRRGDVSFPSVIVTERAQRVLREAGLDLEADRRQPQTRRAWAGAIEEHLRTSFGYSLDPPIVPAGVDPVEWFLVEGRDAHCEFFASAMAAMCRSVGVPARVVTGYLAVEWNQGSGSYTVRAANAHAWVEVLVDDGLWQTFDPTPPADLARVHQRPASMLRSLSQIGDALNHFWLSRVMSFGANEQGATNRRAWLSDLASWFSAPVDRSGSRESPSWILPAAGMGIACVGLAILLTAMRARARRAQTSPTFPAAPARGPLAFYASTLRALRSLGLDKPTSTPPLDHARDIRPASDHAADVLTRSAELYYAAVFGQRQPSPQDIADVREEVRRLARAGRPSHSGQERAHA